MLSNVERLTDTTSRVCAALSCGNAGSAGGYRDSTHASADSTRASADSTRTSAEGRTLIESIDALADQVLARLISDASRARAEFDTVLTAAAGVAAKRSERALGHAGLAQRNGHQNAVRFVQSLTGASRGEASRQVRMGGAMGEVDAAERARRSAKEMSGALLVDGGGSDSDGLGGDGPEGGPSDGNAGDLRVGSAANSIPLPWSHPIVAAVSAGILSPAAGDAIARGLGEPNATCEAEAMRLAASALVNEARSTHVDELFGLARRKRDEIDPLGVRERWQRRYDNRSWTMRRNHDGQLTAHAVFDDESGVFVTQLLDLALSPRRGGPRFVSEDDRRWSDELAADPRSNEQLALDTMMEVLRGGAAMDDSTTLRTHRPAVRVMVTRDDDAPDGVAFGIGHLEGSVDAVPLSVIETHLCNAGTIDVHTDEAGNVLDLGRESRLFNGRQRVVLRTRDGGCVWPGCDRAPWSTEAHHIDAWAADHGRTDIADGVLLCRFHHLLLHNNGWKISRDNTQYLLMPPKSVDPARTPIELHTKSPGWAHHRRVAKRRPPGARSVAEPTPVGGAR
ncbi:hypothetical protein GCM10028798_01750 [Humibacter antri]